MHRRNWPITALVLSGLGMTQYLKRENLFAALAHIKGWVKQDLGTIYVGFAYLIAPQKLKIVSRSANPTRLVADLRLNQPTVIDWPYKVDTHLVGKIILVGMHFRSIAFSC